MSLDLHLHSWLSDGLLAPVQVMANAARAGRSLVSLTDHDTMAGIPEGAAEAARLSMRFVAGIECTTVLNGGSEEIHVLGYHLRHDDPIVLELCTRTQRALRARLAEQIDLVRRKHGSDITFEEVEASAPHTRVLDRPHLARVMVARGMANGSHEIFTRHLADSGDCFVPVRGVECREAIAAMRRAGGLPVLAHPKYFQYPKGATPEAVAPLVEAGLLGIEVYHGTHTLDEVGRYRALAEQFGLMMTGGSDCHGALLGDGGYAVDHECVPEWVAAHFDSRGRELLGPSLR